MRKWFNQKIGLSVLVAILFPMAMFRFIYAIIKGWNKYLGELVANFPFAHVLSSYNPSLYDSLIKFPYTRPWFKETNNWFYGPIHHLWLFPLSWIAPSADVFFHSLMIFYVFAILGVLYFLYKDLRQDNTYMFFFVLLTLVLGSMQLNENLIQRNVEIFEFLLIIICYLCLKKNKEYTGGSVLCFAAMAKLLPFIFLPYLIIKKRNKAVMGFLVTFMIIVVVTQVVLGWQNYFLFSVKVAARHGMPTVSSLLGDSYLAPISQLRGSFYTFILSFFADIDMSQYVPMVIYKVKNFLIPNLLYFISAGFIFIMSFYRFYKNKNGDLFSEFSVVCLLMLLLSPRCNPHYYIFSLLSSISIFKALFLNTQMSMENKKLVGIIFVLSLLLMGHIIPFKVYEYIFPLKNVAFHYFSTYSLFGCSAFILWGLMMYLPLESEILP